MRYALIALTLGSALSVTGAARAQMPQSDALRLASDIRWAGGNCPALRVDYAATQRFMDRSGLMNAFNPDGPLQPYLLKHDRQLDDGLRAVGTETMCQSLLDKYRSTGLLVIRSAPEIDDLNKMRSSSGGDPVTPLR